MTAPVTETVNAWSLPMTARLLPVPLVMLLALTACKREAAPDAAAAGQILPGSASDAMLPSDRLTSQPPLDPRADRATAGEGKEAATDAPGSAGGAAAAPVAEASGAAD